MHTSHRRPGWLSRIKLRHLEGFLILNASRTLSEAATHMHMTQSAVSHWLADLESLAGTTLVQRGRQLRLTPAGEVLCRLAIRTLGEVGRAYDEFDAVRQGASASLHIGSVTAGTAHMVPAAICELQRQRPDIAVRMSEGKLDDLLAGLEKRELDLIVGSIDARTYQPHLRHEVLFKDDIAVIVRPAHPLTRKADASWASLVDYPWVMPPAHTLMRMQLDAELLKQGGAGIRPRVETASVVTIETVLQRTDYVSVCSGALAKHLQARGSVRALGMTTTFGPVGAVWRDDGLSPGLADLLQAMRDEVAAAARQTAPV